MKKRSMIIIVSIVLLLTVIISFTITFFVLQLLNSTPSPVEETSPNTMSNMTTHPETASPNQSAQADAKTIYAIH